MAHCKSTKAIYWFVLPTSDALGYEPWK